nr:anaerobic ribonucleoside-triphosphate reductase activating protein [uncultured Desulfuromonas sp.]
MGIKGFQGTSVLDFPGRIASLVFYGGCNLSCGFCHNPTLIDDFDQYPDMPVEALLDALQQRLGFIDGVVISGGEPTLAPSLSSTLTQIKEMGLAVKLDTNGLRPDVVARLLEQNLLDYVALDVKTSPERYGELHHRPVALGELKKTVDLLLNGTVDYEFRTTCVPGLVEEKDIQCIAHLLDGGRRWILQQFVAEHAMDESMQHCEAFSSQVLQGYAEVARAHVQQVELRGL